MTSKSLDGVQKPEAQEAVDMDQEKEQGLVSNIRRKRSFVILAAGVVTVIVVLAVVFSRMNSPERRIARHLSLGNQYITEGKYEEAIAEFTAAISIDPGNPELVPAYVARGRAYAATGQPQGAVNDIMTAEKIGGSKADYQSGNTVDQQIAAAIDQIIVNSVIDNKGNLQESADYLEAIGWKSYLPSDESQARKYVDAINLLENVREEVSGDHYDEALREMQDAANINMLDDAIGTDSKVYLYDDQKNMITAFYRIEAETRNFENVQYMFYYGNGIVENDSLVRKSDRSVWLGGIDDNKYISIGSWDNDMPDGTFISCSWQQSFNAQVSSRVLSGNVVQGLFDGEIQWSFVDQAHGQSTYAPLFSNGVAQNILTDNDNHTVIYQNDNNGAELVLPGDVGTDETFGIIGFAQNA